eukprot:20570_1
MSSRKKKKSTKKKNKNSNKYDKKDKKEMEKLLNAQRKELKQLKNAKNKLENEQQKMLKHTKRKSIKDVNQTKRLRLELEEYKSEVQSLKKYKKQIHTLKKKQSKKNVHKNDKIKYIWAENIQQIKILNENEGAMVVFDDKNQKMLPNIKIIQENMKKTEKKLQENTKIINYLVNELNERTSDIKYIQSIINYNNIQQNTINNYVTDHILKRHNENKI